MAAARRSISARCSIGRSCRPTKTSGSGVGLFVCGRLLQQMNGQIRLLGDRPSGFAVSSSCRRRSDGARIARRRRPSLGRRWPSAWSAKASTSSGCRRYAGAVAAAARARGISRSSTSSCRMDPASVWRGRFADARYTPIMFMTALNSAENRLTDSSSAPTSTCPSRFT